MSRPSKPRLAPGGLDRQRTGGHRRGVRTGVRAAAAQQRAHSRHQLAHAERLRQVVVGAAVEAEYLVGLVAPRREHQDRRLGIARLAANGAAQRHAVEPGQHQVENQQIESAPPGRAGALPLRRRRRLAVCPSSCRCSTTSSRMCSSSSTTRTRAPGGRSAAADASVCMALAGPVYPRRPRPFRLHRTDHGFFTPRPRSCHTKPVYMFKTNVRARDEATYEEQTPHCRWADRADGP